MNEDKSGSSKLLKKISEKVKRAIHEYGLIEDNDHILIGLSGGKDSLALVQLLGERMKIFVPKFQLTAVHISVTNISYQSDLKYLQEHCQSYGIPFVHHTTSFERLLEEKKSMCFLCSWHRRKALFEVAQIWGATRLPSGII